MTEIFSWDWDLKLVLLTSILWQAIYMCNVFFSSWTLYSVSPFLFIYLVLFEIVLLQCIKNLRLPFSKFLLNWRWKKPYMTICFAKYLLMKQNFNEILITLFEWMNLKIEWNNYNKNAGEKHEKKKILI